MRHQPRYKAVTIRACNRVLTRCVNIGNQHRVGIVETAAEITEQVFQPGVAMRLHNGDDAVFRFQHPGCAEGGPNFNRVMTVIINDHDITRTALEFKAAANAAETVQPCADCLNGNPHL